MDLQVYALCKKLISQSSTGIRKIEVNDDGDLVFTMADGSVIVVDMPIKLDCVDFTFVDSLPISGMEKNKVYVVKTALVDQESNIIYRQYMWVNEQWKFIGISGEPIATTTQVGLVKPDGTSIQADESGTISVKEDFIYTKINSKTTTNSDIDSLFTT